MTQITVLCTKHHKAQQLIQPYFHKIYKWVTNNNLNINTDKTTTSLFTPNPAKYGTTKQSNTTNNKTHKNFWFYARPKANIFTTHKCNDIKTKEHLTFLKHSFLPNQDKQKSNSNNNMPQILVLRDKLVIFIANFIL